VRRSNFIIDDLFLVLPEETPMRLVQLKAAVFTVIIIVTGIIFFSVGRRCESMDTKKYTNTVNLPVPRYDGKISVEKSLLKRRSVRTFKKVTLTLADVSQVLWAAQGQTDQRGFRTAPSAGALYPLEVYIVAGDVEDLATGIYRYIPKGHKLTLVEKGDKRSDLCKAALSQSSIQNAPFVIVFSGIPKRTTGRYGERGMQYVFIEVGHVAQNVCLQAVSMELGAVVMGAFDDSRVKKILNMGEDELPLYILPVGRVELDIK
jgi:SagB-type dehydrogenase family enzyme